MSVNGHLSRLGSELVLSTQENASIRTSVTTLSARLSSHFGDAISSQFRFGSSTRGTILPRKADARSDVDYMVVFDTTTEGQKKPQTYLNRLKAFAEARYSSSDIVQSSPTIVLSLQHISFELVPAVYSFGYQIRAPASSWAEWLGTDPKSTDEALQAKNKAEAYQIKPLVRLIKYWNATKAYPFWSFEMSDTSSGAITQDVLRSVTTSIRFGRRSYRPGMPLST